MTTPPNQLSANRSRYGIWRRRKPGNQKKKRHKTLNQPRKALSVRGRLLERMLFIRPRSPASMANRNREIIQERTRPRSKNGLTSGICGYICLLVPARRTYPLNRLQLKRKLSAYLTPEWSGFYPLQLDANPLRLHLSNSPIVVDLSSCASRPRSSLHSSTTSSSTSTRMSRREPTQMQRLYRLIQRNGYEQFCDWDYATSTDQGKVWYQAIFLFAGSPIYSSSGLWYGNQVDAKEDTAFYALPVLQAQVYRARQ